MQIFARSILRCCELATSSPPPAPAPCLRSFMAVAAADPPRCWWRPRARVRGDLLPSAPPVRPVRRPVCCHRPVRRPVCCQAAKTRASAGLFQTNFRLFHNNGSRNMASTTGIKGEPDNGKQDNGRGIGAHDDDEKKYVRKKKKKKVTRDDIFLLCGEGPPGGELSQVGEFSSSEDEEFCCNCSDDVDPMAILPYSTHRDGSIYRIAGGWRKDYCIADRDETRWEAMMLSNPKECMFYGATCWQHRPERMLQIFSLKLAKIQVAEGGPVELYGYVAARDTLDPLLNYVVNVNRDDPILVEQGSLIEITGPKRGIELCYATLIEYDMRIKTGKQEKDDLQLIDGVSFIDEIRTSYARKPFTRRIHGDRGAVDITLLCVNEGVEATVEVVVLEVRSNFSLCVGCFTSGLDQEIRLFDGIISESRGLRRSVVAVLMDTWIDLKLRVGSGPCYNSDNEAEHCCTFKVTNHGYTSQLVKVKFATILVKVTWSTLSMLVA